MNSATLNHPIEQSQPPPDQPQSRHRGHRWLLWLITGVLIGGGLTGFLAGSDSEGTSSEAIPQTPPPRPVEVTRLASGAGVRTIELIGQVEARTSATLRAQISGVVQQILVEPGDTLGAGATVAILDASDQQLALSQAQASLASERNILAELESGTRPEIIEQRQAELQATRAREQEAADNLQRIQNLVGEGALSERSLIEARTAVDATRAEALESAAALAPKRWQAQRLKKLPPNKPPLPPNKPPSIRLNSGSTAPAIQATTHGVVESRTANVGDYLEAGTPVLSLINREELDVYLEIPEELTGQVTPDLPVNLTARALPDWQGQASIAGTIPTANEASRRKRVRLQLDNPPVGLLPGMAIQGTLELKSDTPGFTISRDALVQRTGEWVVFTVVDGQAQELEVDLVADRGETVSIFSDQLQHGQVIILRGAEGLQDGAVVHVTNE